MGTISKELSVNSKELIKGSTEKYQVGNLIENCENIKIEITNANRLKVSYSKYYYDGNGEVMDIKPMVKTLFITDEAEEGTVDLDENLSEVPNTYVKNKDEVLNITNIKTQLDTIIQLAIDKVKVKEGYDKL